MKFELRILVLFLGIAGLNCLHLTQIANARLEMRKAMDVGKEKLDSGRLLSVKVNSERELRRMPRDLSPVRSRKLSEVPARDLRNRHKRRRMKHKVRHRRKRHKVKRRKKRKHRKHRRQKRRRRNKMRRRKHKIHRRRRRNRRHRRHKVERRLSQKTPIKQKKAKPRKLKQDDDADKILVQYEPVKKKQNNKPKAKKRSERKLKVNKKRTTDKPPPRSQTRRPSFMPSAPYPVINATVAPAARA